MGTDIMPINDMRLEEIKRIIDVDRAVELLKQIAALKAALDCCDRFRENAIKYARLEAAALIRVAELGGVKKIRGNYRRKAAEWLFELSESDRDGFIAMCAEGLTIEQVYKREVYLPKKTDENLEMLESFRAEILNEFKTDGCVDLGEWCHTARACIRLPDSTISDFFDGTRIALRKAGALGCGDGLYVREFSAADKDRAPEKMEEIARAVRLRLASIVADIKKVEKIVFESRISVKMQTLADPEEVLYHIWGGEKYLADIFGWLDRIGAVSNYKLYKAGFEKAASPRAYLDPRHIDELPPSEKFKNVFKKEDNNA